MDYYCRGCRYKKWWRCPRRLSGAQKVKIVIASVDPARGEKKQRVYTEIASEFCRKKMTNLDGSCGHYRQRWWALRQRRDINVR